MKIKSVDYDDGKPATVTAVLDIYEAAAIAVHFGATSPAQNERLMPGFGASACSSVTNALNGVVFDPYWEDGVPELVAELSRKANA